MTPAQEAKEYAARHGFSIGNVVGAKRYFVYRTGGGTSDAIAEVGGYPAALNAMKRYVQEQAESAALQPPRACSEAFEDAGRCWFVFKPGIIRGNWHVRIQYAQPDQNGDSVFHASRESRTEAIKFVRQHLSSIQGRHVISQSVTYGA